MSDAPYFTDDSVRLHHGDALEVLRQMPDVSVNCCVTSPPYFGLRDYGVEGQYGLESSPAEYVETMRVLFAEVRRVLADDGTLWLNLGDSYASGGRNAYDTEGGKTRARGHAARRPTSTLPGKNLLGIPWRVAFALQDGGWILRNDIIWAKPNAMPESTKDRLSTKHEHVFMLSKSPTYWFDLDPIKVPTTGLPSGNSLTGQARYGSATAGGDGRRFGGNASSTLLEVHETRNPGDVWALPTQPFVEAHFAVMPQALAERAILAGCQPGGVVLDPFSGSGTTGLAATKHGRKYVGIDLNAEYLDLSLRTRFAQPGLDLNGGVA